MKDQVMMDLESMSVAPDAAIISIGAIRFDLETGEMGETFYRVVNLKSAQKSGGRIDAETVMWWLMQSEDARKAVTGDDSILIDTALREFANYLREAPLEGLWGNGSDFDNVALAGAYARLGWTQPWKYTSNRCYRTICKLFKRYDREKFREGTHHNALSDAITQAKHLCDIWKTK